MSKLIHNFESNSELKQATRPDPSELIILQYISGKVWIVLFEPTL
jgi:hypothetical protein